MAGAANAGRPNFAPLTLEQCNNLVLDDAPLGSCAVDDLQKRASACGIKLGDETQLRLLIGSLLAATGGSFGAHVWSEVRDEARGLLLLAIRREGRVSESTAEALNVLNKPAVVEKYRALGNRWTISEASREAPSAIERARKELGDDGSLNTGEWLRALADSLEAVDEPRPFWASTLVLFVVSLTAIFILVHVALLVRVLFKACCCTISLRLLVAHSGTRRACGDTSHVATALLNAVRCKRVQVHDADQRVLLYPFVGLSASALVGGFALFVNKLSEAPKRA